MTQFIATDESRRGKVWNSDKAAAIQSDHQNVPPKYKKGPGHF